MKPDFAVHLDGNKLGGEEAAAVLGIRVFQTRSGSSAFELVVSDPNLKWQAKPTFTDCKEVQIELGVPGKLKKVFDGEVTAWRTELERAGPTVLVLRGMDRSHRLMRGHKTKTYAEASPIDCAQQIASAAGLTAKTSAGQPAPVKTFRLQANESDFSFLRKMADLEGYLFYVDGSDLHFERPKLSSKDDLTVTFGEDLKTFLPVANFRRPAAKVEVGAWDSTGKAALTGKASPGDELWSVPGGKPGADVAKFQGTKASVSLVESQVATQEHADTVAKAALTRRSLEFLTAEVEVQGNPEIKPGAMVNVKKVGVYSGHYLVTEANHFFDAGGYSCIFYVARDKWGDSSTDAEKKRSAEEERKKGKERAEQPYKPPEPPPGNPPADDTIDFTLEGDDGKPLKNVKCKVKLKSGEVIEATTDADGHVHIDEKPEGPYTVEITGDALELTSIDIAVEDVEGAPVAGASGKVKLSDGSEIAVTTDAEGNVHLEDVPKGEYTFTLEAPAAGGATPAGDGGTEGGGTPGQAAPAGKGGGGAAPAQTAPAAGGGKAGGTPGPGGGAAGGSAPGGAAAGGVGGASGTGTPGSAPAGDAAPGAGAPPAGGGAKAGTGTQGGAAAGGAAPGAAAPPGGAAAKPGAAAPGGAPAGGGAPGQGAPAAGGAKADTTASGGGTAGGAAPAAGAPPAGPGAKPSSTASGSGPAAGGGTAPAGGKEVGPAAGRGHAVVAESPGSAGAGSKTAPGSPASTTPGKAPGPAQTGAADPKSAATGGAPGSATAPAPATGAATTPTGPATAPPAPAATPAAAPAPAPTPAGAPAGGAPPPSPPPAPAATTVSAPPQATSGAPDQAAPAGAAPADSQATAPPTGPAAPGETGAPQGEDLSPAEIGGIASGVAAVGSVSTGIASAARSAKAVKDAAESAADGAKVPDSENVEE